MTNSELNTALDSTGLNSAGGAIASNPSALKSPQDWRKWGLIGFAIFYVVLVILLPALNVFVQAFSGGAFGFFGTFTSRPFIHTVGLTLVTAAIAVPLNTVFGLAAAVAIAHKTFPGRTLLISIIDLPFSISPVVAGLRLVLLYGSRGWFGPLLEAGNIKIIFALPGMVMATIFVTMPFIARQVLRFEVFPRT